MYLNGRDCLKNVQKTGFQRRDPNLAGSQKIVPCWESLPQSKFFEEELLIIHINQKQSFNSFVCFFFVVVLFW